MKTTKLVATMVMVAAMIGITACSNFFGPDSAYKSAEATRKTMISDAQLSTLKNMGMPINDGDNPPDVSGYFEANDMDCIKDSDGYESSYQDFDYYFYFHNLVNNNLRIDYKNKYGSDKGSGQGALIFGEGNSFTIYMQTQGSNSTYNISYTTVDVYSGTLTSSGITNFHQSFIMTSKTGDTNNYLMPVNAARVYKEGDGLVAKLNSNPGFSSNIRSVINATQKSIVMNAKN